MSPSSATRPTDSAEPRAPRLAGWARDSAAGAGSRFRFNLTVLLLSGILLAVLMSANGMSQFQFGSSAAQDESLSTSDTYVVLERPKGEVVLFLIGWLGVVLALVSLAIDGVRAGMRRMQQK